MSLRSKPILNQAGASLVEMVVSIVVISITVTSVMMVVAQTSRSSADPLVRAQAMAVARAYMEEILGQALEDPDGGETGGSETGESRATFDDIADYDGLADSGAVDQQGNPIDGLASYNVVVAVTSATLGGSPARRIQVTATFGTDSAFAVPLVAYRLR